MKKKILNVALIGLINFAFIGIVNAETYNNYAPSTVSCGGALLKNIPSALPKAISILYIIIQVAVPIVLVIMGSLDLFKGITAQKEDEITKARQIFIKRIIAAAIVFFVFTIVRLVVSITVDGNSGNILDCAECFIKNKCS